ncbi:MAG: methyltransferase [Chloroflexi bacterium]|nr:methyltransferase [Chloroflexota bacterium]
MIQRSASTLRAFISTAAGRVGRALLAESRSARLPTIWLTGAWVSQAMAVAARLDLADRLAGNPRSTAALAGEIGADPEALRRLLRMLVGLGLFSEDRQGRFRTTRLGACLRRDHPQSVHGIALMIGSEWHRRAWGNLEHAVRTGESGFRHAFGRELYDYLRDHPSDAQVFGQHIEAYARQAAVAAASYDFSDASTVVDVGGGYGTVLTAVLRANPGLRGVLLDLPDVVESARSHVTASDVAARCELVGGSFFASAPAGADVYLLSSVIHNWDDARAIEILTVCRAAMSASSRLVLVELTMPTGNDPGDARMLDVQMMVLFEGGHERTSDEYRALLEAAGLRLTRVLPTPNEMSLIEAVRA